MNSLEVIGSPDADRKILMGSRKSPLALWQSRTVARSLVDKSDSVCVEIMTLDTRGDLQLAQPLPVIGGKGLFTAELDDAIRSSRLSLAVHSLKDLPTAEQPGLLTAVVLPRADWRDVLVARENMLLDELPLGAKIGTSSPRRHSQLLALRQDLSIGSVRGNVQTRIGKVDSGEFDAVILAAAGLHRIGKEHHISQALDATQMLPAPGQGALAVTCRDDDADLIELLNQIVDVPTASCVSAERKLLELLGGGCSAPVGALAEIVATAGEAARLSLTGRVAALDGTRQLTESAIHDHRKKSPRWLLTNCWRAAPASY